MNRSYLIGQNNVGQNFRHLKKMLSLLSDEKICPFSKFEISSKRLNSFISLEIHPFFTIRITKKPFYFSTIMFNGGFIFTFGLISSLQSPRYPHHRNREFAVAFYFLWFNHLTILILIYYNFDSFFFFFFLTSFSSSFLASKSQE